MNESELSMPLEPPEEVRQQFVPVPKEYVEEVYRSDDYLVLIGPQHPGSGHMRIVLRIDGDVIVEAIPDPGFVHRSVEKIAENRLYMHNIPLIERVSLTDCPNMSTGYVRVIEQALDIDVPPRAQYIRTILSELTRIGTHVYDAGILAVFLGHSTGFMWGFGMRELIIESLLKMTGVRISTSFSIPGGVRRDVDEDALETTKKMLVALENRLQRFEHIFIKNPVTVARMQDVGTLDRNAAIRYGLTGPFLRASGVEYDVRKVEPYDAYDKVDWDLVTGDVGDGYSRLLVRANEITQSIAIIRNAIAAMEYGPTLGGDLGENGRGARRSVNGHLYELMSLTLPKGQYTSLTEAARGTMYYSITSDGESTVPYRVRLISPGWFYLRGFMEAVKGERVADLQTVYGSFGYFPPEADR